MSASEALGRMEMVRWDRTKELRDIVLPVLYSLGPKARINRIHQNPEDSSVVVHVYYDDESFVFWFGLDSRGGYDAWVEVLLRKLWLHAPDGFLESQKKNMRAQGYELIVYDQMLAMRMPLERLGSSQDVQGILDGLLAHRRRTLSAFEKERQYLPLGVPFDRRKRRGPPPSAYDEPGNKTIQ